MASFSAQFIGYIKEVNVQNVNSPSQAQQHGLLQEVVEEHCKRNPDRQTWGSKNIPPPSELHRFAISAYAASSYVDLYAKTFNTNNRESVEELAKLNGLSPETLFGAVATKMPWTDSTAHCVASVPSLPRSFSCEGKRYTLCSDIVHLRTPTGRVGGGLAVYRAENGLEALLPLRLQLADPRNPCVHELVPGMPADPFPLLYQDILEKYSSATVLYCENPLVAKAVNDLVADWKSIAAGTFVATSRYGGTRNLANVSFGLLWGRRVIYVPDISRESHIAAEEYEKRCAAANVESFRVLRKPLLRFRAHGDPDAAGALGEPFERHLAQEALALPDMESAHFRKMVESAISLQAFQDWGRKVHLLQDGSQDSASPGGTLADLLDAPVVSVDSGKHYLEELASPMLIHGESNAGKSMLGLSIAYAEAVGLPILGFDAGRPKHVTLIDAESGLDRLRGRMRRLNSAYPAQRDLLKNLRYRSLHDEDNEKIIDITTDFWKKEIARELEAYPCDFVVFDNLISLVPDFRGKRGAWAKVKEWYRELEVRFRVRVLFLHHSNGSGDPSGSRDIEAQCQTVLVLQGGKDLPGILKGKEYANTPLPSYCDKNGALFLGRFTKCKAYPDLEYKEFGAFLEYNQGKPTEGEPWEFLWLSGSLSSERALPETDFATASVPVDVVPDENDALADENAALDEEIEGMSPEEQNILELAGTRQAFACGDVEELLHCGRSKAQALLKSLLEKNRLDRIGNGKATCYRLRRD